MAFRDKTDLTHDAAVLSLWRVAENGDVEELSSLLPRVRDINARNEYGVTALMRAAQYGHLKMVRALLEHGADANIVRNDKFTALSLAAFFGHTEVVKALMEHGADSRASTRSGTSPHMWATARTFNEVANQLHTTLESPAAPKPLPKAKEQILQPAPQQRPAAPTVVRTLKDPPEIWDLVHEAPRRFNATSVFVARLQSMKRSLAFRVAMVVVLIGACAVGVLVLRGVQARSEANSAAQPKQLNTAPAPAVQSESANTVPREDTNVESNSPAAATAAPTTTVATTVGATETGPTVPEARVVANDNHRSSVGRRLSSRSSVTGPRRVDQGQLPRIEASENNPPVVSATEKPEPKRPVEPATKTKVDAPLSPHLIAPAKSAAPKPKVIQWP